MKPCSHCKGSGALWNTYVGTWEPCGCDEREAEDDGPDPDDERDRRMEDDRLREEDNDTPDFFGDD